jgi:hypothetical protein
MKNSGTMRRKAAWLVGFGFFTATGLLFFSYRYLDDLAREKTGTFGERLIEEMTGAYAAALLFPLVLRVARRFRLDWRNWLRLLPVHLLALLLCSTGSRAIYCSGSPAWALTITGLCRSGT